MSNTLPSNITEAYFKIITSATYQVQTGSDDCGGYRYYYEESTGDICYEWEYNLAYVGAFNHIYSTGQYHCDIRFSGYLNLAKKSFMRIPVMDVHQGTTIVGADLELYVSNGSYGGTANFRIYGHDADTGGKPTNYSQLDALTLTTNYATWNSSTMWTSGNWYTVPGLKDVIQEVVNRPGYMIGNPITLVCVGIPNSNDRGWNGSGYTNAPKLNLSWQA